MRISLVLAAILLSTLFSALLLPQVSGQTSSPTISINGDADLVAQATGNNWPGSGLFGDPYLIDDLLISAAIDDGIAVRNTTLHLTIRNCIISGNDAHNGIVLDNVTNAVIENNTISDQLLGISLQWSVGNQVANNSIRNSSIAVSAAVAASTVVEGNNASNNRVGISFYFADLSQAANNTVSDNDEGLRITYSDDVIASRNTIANNLDLGLLLLSSLSVELTNNSFTGAGLEIIGSRPAWNTHTITGNTVNGGPLVYLANTSSGVATLGAGQIVLAAGENMSIVDQDISQTSTAILVGHSNFTVVDRNTLTSNGRGVVMRDSHNSVLRENVLRSNGVGVNLTGVTSSSLFENRFLFNSVQAWDDDGNTWDGGATGGNFWSDYTGSDFAGDGIGDQVHPISGGSAEDRFPLSPALPAVQLQVPSYPVLSGATAVDLDWVISGGLLPYDIYLNSSGVPITSTPSAPYDWTVPLVTGAVNVSLTVVDGGLRSAGDTWTFIVDSNAPTVLGVDHDPEMKKIAVTFSEAMDQGSVEIALDGPGGMVVPSWDDGVLGLDTTGLEDGDYTLALNGSDLSFPGNTMEEFTYQFTIQGEESPTDETQPLQSGVPAVVAVALMIQLALVVALLAVFSNESLKYRFFLVLSPLYTKLRREKVMTHGVRERIYAEIQERGGQAFTEVRKKLVLSNGVFSYHISVLEREGFIRSTRDGRYRRLWSASENTNTVLADEEQELLDIITDRPGLTVSELGEAVGVGKSTMHYRLKKLAAKGVIEYREVKHGRVRSKQVFPSSNS